MTVGDPGSGSKVGSPFLAILRHPQEAQTTFELPRRMQVWIRLGELPELIITSDGFFERVQRAAMITVFNSSQCLRMLP